MASASACRPHTEHSPLVLFWHCVCEQCFQVMLRSSLSHSCSWVKHFASVAVRHACLNICAHIKALDCTHITTYASVLFNEATNILHNTSILHTRLCSLSEFVLISVFNQIIIHMSMDQDQTIDGPRDRKYPMQNGKCSRNSTCISFNSPH